MGMFKWIRRALGGLWGALDRLRKLLHLFFLLLIFMFILVGLVPPQVQVPDSAALILAPQGALVEQLSGDPLERAVAKARGIPLDETRLKDLVDAIRAAGEDERIKVLVLQLDDLGDAGLSKLQELADEILAFKQTGKPVVAVGDSFTRNQYYLAAQADEVYMHPMGFVLIDGYSRFQPYFKSALDQLDIDYHVWSAGEYKSFVEMVTRDDMSAQDREASEAYLRGLWSSYQLDVTSARELQGDALQRYADEAVFLLRDAGGDSAVLARDYGFVDTLATRDEFRSRIRAIVDGDSDSDEGEDFPQIHYDDYLLAVRATPPSESAGKVAVIVASGQILDGSQPSGTIGGDSLADLIRGVERDDDVDALVLRVDSPGGSAFASDVILRELDLFQASGRPLLVSMSSVAASGGYWISMGADEIWASPTTLTGSIGVFAMFPSIARLLDRWGVHVDGLGTTSLAGQFDPTRELGPDADALLRQSIDHAYAQFVAKVADAREMPVAAIDAVARGRVWVGTDALEAGLVDRLGHLEDAVHSAAERAGLEEGNYDVEYIERPLGVLEELAMHYATVWSPLARAWSGSAELGFAWPRWFQAAVRRLDGIQRLNDPRNIYAYCFCEVR